MPQKKLIKTLRLCCLIEEAARDVYSLFAGRASDPALREFWEHMKRDEEHHLAYWQELIEAAVQGDLPNVFNDTRRVCQDLETLMAQVEKIRMAGSSVGDDSGESFLLAYLLEFYLLHPAFEACFCFLKGHADCVSPTDEYKAHLDRFITGFKKFNRSQPDLGLFAQFLEKIWHSNRDLAREIASANNIGGLIAICSDCHKIFTEEGTWKSVAYYVKKKMDESFTHWLCPACMEKLYPGFYEKYKQKIKKMG